MSKSKNALFWALGILLCMLGVALCTKANFGLSMIAAPVYILHIKLVETFSWYSQGTSEYIFQIVIVLLTFFITRKFRVKYVLSFVTAILSGFALDFWFLLLGGNGAYEGLLIRIPVFILGEALTALAIAFFFRTNFPVQGYELIVSEISKKYGIKVEMVKLYNDIVYLVLSFALALLLNRSFQGIGIGTVIITLVNAPLIDLFGKIIDKITKRLSH